MHPSYCHKLTPANLSQYQGQGYIWWSDQHTGEVVDRIDPDWLAQTLPFIVEGNLYVPDKQYSIRLRHTGAGYEIIRFDLQAIDSGRKVARQYLCNLPEKTYFSVYEIWEPQAGQASLANMPALRPYASVFAGFTPLD